jgi:hypothetical protein
MAKREKEVPIFLEVMSCEEHVDVYLLIFFEVSRGYYA